MATPMPAKVEAAAFLKKCCQYDLEWQRWGLERGGAPQRSLKDDFCLVATFFYRSATTRGTVPMAVASVAIVANNFGFLYLLTISREGEGLHPLPGNS